MERQLDAAVNELAAMRRELAEAQTQNHPVKTAMQSDCFFYIGAAPCEGYGTFSVSKYDPSCPIGEIRQIHGSGAGKRDIYFTLEPGKQASRLICGLTWSQDGGWTSWPPHQHENDLEEAYCYFDMEDPHGAFHLSYCDAGDIENAVFRPVKSGTVVLAPRGYHPTVALPGSVNSYFWALAAFSHDSRRYDLAVEDPTYSQKNEEEL